MRTMKIVTAAIAFQLASGRAFAQTATPKVESGHHYQGGPKTEVPHHMQDMKETTTGKSTAKSKSRMSHGYQGGPKSDMPHKMDR